MRDYGIVSPRFWIGATGKELRKHPYAQRVALYLMSAPSSEMTGVYYCPVTSILFEVGSPFDAPSKGLQEQIDAVKEALSILSDLDFCLYDFESEYVFVKEMARWQIAEFLKASDKRVIAVRKAVASMPLAFQRAFVERYNVDFCLGFSADEIAKIASPIEAPSMPHRSQEQEQKQEQKHIKAPASAKKPTAITHTLDLEELPEDWKQYCLNRRPDLDPEMVFIDFKGWWVNGRGAGTMRSDKSWTSTWQTWVRNQKEGKQHAPATPKRSIFAATPETTSMKPIDRHAQARGDAPDPRELFGGLI